MQFAGETACATKGDALLFRGAGFSLSVIGRPLQ
jgi:hypothetical protein